MRLAAYTGQPLLMAGGIQNEAAEGEFPVVVGATHVQNDSGSTGVSVPVALPPGWLSTDMGLLVIAKGNGGTTAMAFPSGFAALDDDVPRLSSASGENMRLGIGANTTPITTGFNVTLNSYGQAKFIAIRGATSATWDSAGRERAAAQDQNSMSLQEPTFTGDALAIAVLAGSWSNAKATFAACTDWAAVSTVTQFSNSTAAARYGCQALWRTVTDSVPSGTITTSGSANAYLVSTTVIVQ